MKNIKKSILSYLNSEEKTGVFIVDGSWGSGKTCFIKKEIQKEKKNLIFISMYGISSVEQLNNIVKNEYTTKVCINIDKYGTTISKTLDFINSVVDKEKYSNTKITALKLGLDALSTGVNSLLPLVPIVNNTEYYFVFDDIERAKLNFDILMGYVNDLCENKGFKTIVILNKNGIKNNLMNDKCENVDSHIEEAFEKIAYGKLDFKISFDYLYKGIVNEIVNEKYADLLKDKEVKEGINIIFNALDDITFKNDQSKHEVQYNKTFPQKISLRSLKYAVTCFRQIFDILCELDICQKQIKNYLFSFIGAYMYYREIDKLKDITCDSDIFEEKTNGTNYKHLRKNIYKGDEGNNYLISIEGFDSDTYRDNGKDIQVLERIYGDYFDENFFVFSEGILCREGIFDDEKLKNEFVSNTQRLNDFDNGRVLLHENPLLHSEKDINKKLANIFLLANKGDLSIMEYFKLNFLMCFLRTKLKVEFSNDVYCNIKCGIDLMKKRYISEKKTYDTHHAVSYYDELVDINNDLNDIEKEILDLLNEVREDIFNRISKDLFLSNIQNDPINTMNKYTSLECFCFDVEMEQSLFDAYCKDNYSRMDLKEMMLEHFSKEHNEKGFNIELELEKKIKETSDVTQIFLDEKLLDDIRKAKTDKKGEVVGNTPEFKGEG